MSFLAPCTAAFRQRMPTQSHFGIFRRKLLSRSSFSFVEFYVKIREIEMGPLLRKARKINSIFRCNSFPHSVCDCSPTIETVIISLIETGNGLKTQTRLAHSKESSTNSLPFQSQNNEVNWVHQDTTNRLRTPIHVPIPDAEKGHKSSWRLESVCCCIVSQAYRCHRRHNDAVFRDIAIVGRGIVLSWNLHITSSDAPALHSTLPACLKMVFANLIVFAFACSTIHCCRMCLTHRLSQRESCARTLLRNNFRNWVSFEWRRPHTNTLLTFVRDSGLRVHEELAEIQISFVHLPLSLSFGQCNMRAMQRFASLDTRCLAVCRLSSSVFEL